MRELQNEQELMAFFITHNVQYIKTVLTPYKTQMLELKAARPESDWPEIDKQYTSVLQEKIADLMEKHLTVSRESALMMSQLINLKEIV